LIAFAMVCLTITDSVHFLRDAKTSMTDPLIIAKTNKSDLALLPTMATRGTAALLVRPALVKR
jgi:hypothetical protein